MWFEILKEFGFSAYEIKALGYLSRKTQVTATQISEDEDIPSSKIYMALNSLVNAGFVVEIAGEKTKQYQIAPVGEVISLIRAKGEAKQRDFADALGNLKAFLVSLDSSDNSQILLHSEANSFFRVLESLVLSGNPLQIYLQIDKIEKWEPILARLHSQVKLLCFSELDITSEVEKICPPRAHVRWATKPHGSNICLSMEDSTLWQEISLPWISCGYITMSSNKFIVDWQTWFDRAWFSGKASI